MTLWRRIALVTAASLAVPVLMALTCACVAMPTFNASRGVQDYQVDWQELPLSPPEGWPVPGGGTYHSAFGAEGWARGQRMHRVMTTDITVTAGWPFRCLYAYEYRNEVAHHRGPKRLVARNGVRLREYDYSSTFCILPTRVMWGGYCADAGILFALLAVPVLAPAVRREVRRRRDECIHCGQRRAPAQQRCPECGRHT